MAAPSTATVHIVILARSEELAWLHCFWFSRGMLIICHAEILALRLVQELVTINLPLDVLQHCFVTLF